MKQSNKSFQSLILVLWMGCMLAFSSAAYAATITVNTVMDETTTNDRCSVREALANANNNDQTHPDCAAGSDDDIISFPSSNQVFPPGQTTPIVLNAPLLVTDSGSTTFQGNSAGWVALDGNASHRVMDVDANSGVTLHVERLIVRNGKATDENGGGLRLRNASATVLNSRFESNEMRRFQVNASMPGGFAIYSANTQLSIVQTVLTSNNGIDAGSGAIYSTGGTLRMTRGEVHKSFPTGIKSTNATLLDHVLIHGNKAAQGAGLVLEGTEPLVVDGCEIRDNIATLHGGGLYASGNVTVKNSLFDGNQAFYGSQAGSQTMYGGAVSVVGNHLVTIQDSQFTNNFAFDRGGAINVFLGKLLIEDSTFSDSTVSNASSIGQGGDIWVGNQSEATIKRSNFVASTASGGGSGAIFGGAIANFDSSLTLQDNHFDRYFSPYGGAIYNKNTALTVDACLFTDNMAWRGGAIDAISDGAASSVSVFNSTFSNNQVNAASAQGGAVAVSGAQNQVELYANTWVNNSAATSNGAAGEGGAVWVKNDVTNTVAIGNIFQANLAAQSAGAIRDASGQMLADHNLYFANEASSVASNLCTGCAQDSHPIVADPLLSALADHGGETHSYLPSSGSPAIDAGDSVTCADVDTINQRDQRDVSRSSSGVRCDLGSVEVPQYALEVLVGAGGSVSAAANPVPVIGSIQSCTANGGSCTAGYQRSPAQTVSLTATPFTGYDFVGWGDACSGTSTTIDLLVDGNNLSCEAAFAPKTFAVTYASGANGQVTGDLNQTVNYGNTGTSVTAVPDSGYEFDQWSDGSVENPRLDEAVTQGINVTAQFVVDGSATNQYTISTAVNGQGTLTPSAAETVAENAVRVFTAEPEAGWVLSGINGCPGTLSGLTYTTQPIAGDCTITATFMESSHSLGGTITGLNASGLSLRLLVNGSAADALILASGQTNFAFSTPVVYEANYTVEITSQPSGLVCVVNQASGTMPAMDVSSVAVVCDSASTTFYAVTPTVTGQGSISPNSPQQVADGTQTTFTVQAAVGHTLYAVSGCGMGTLQGNAYTTATVTEDCTVSAVFVANGTSPDTVFTNGFEAAQP